MMPPKDPNDETGKTFIFTEVYRQFGIVSWNLINLCHICVDRY